MIGYQCDQDVRTGRSQRVVTEPGVGEGLWKLLKNVDLVQASCTGSGGVIR